jgi:hypothetical protein
MTAYFINSNQFQHISPVFVFRCLLFLFAFIFEIEWQTLPVVVQQPWGMLKPARSLFMCKMERTFPRMDDRGVVLQSRLRYLGLYFCSQTYCKPACFLPSFKFLLQVTRPTSRQPTTNYRGKHVLQVKNWQ